MNSEQQSLEKTRAQPSTVRADMKSLDRASGLNLLHW